MTIDSTRWLLAAALTVTGLSGCYQYDCPTTADARYYQDPAYVEVQTAPPAVQAAVAVRPQKPSANAFWVGGHYVWRASWVWVGGHWETPRAGYVWTAPTVVRAGGSYRYHPGYWRPRTVQAAPVYRGRGTVAVSVRPPRTTTVRQGGTQTVTVQQGGAAAAPAATVEQGGTTQTQGGTVTTAPTGTRPTVTVQGGTRATTTATVTQPGRNVTVRTPDAGTRATGTATVRTPNNRRPSTMATVRGGVQTATPGAVVRTPNDRPTTMATVRGGVRGGSPGTATVAVGAAGAGAGTVALTCRINTARAPRGGYITVRGAGFGSGATVTIGGNIAAVSRARDGRVRAQVPRDSSGGRVTIRDGNRTASCGTLDIVGR